MKACYLWCKTVAQSFLRAGRRKSQHRSQLGEEMIAPISVNPYWRKELAIACAAVLIIVKNAQHIAS
jgi:hypothetical protein